MAVNEWSINNRLKTATNLLEELGNTYNIGKDIKLVNTEYGTAISNESLKHSITEALYTADNMLTALKYDIRSAINFCLYHWQYNYADLTDNIFFSTDGQTLKPTYFVHKLIAENLGQQVVSSNITQNTSRVNVVTCQPGQAFSYDKLGVVSTKDDDGTLRTMIVNRSEQNVTIGLNVQGGPDYGDIVMKTVGGSSFTDQTANIVTKDLTNLNYITIPKLSANVVIASPEQVVLTDDCEGGGSIVSDCGVTLELDGREIKFKSTTHGGSVIINVRNNFWTWAAYLCNDYNFGNSCSTSSSVTAPSFGTFYVDVQAQGQPVCTFPISLSASTSGGGNDLDNDGVCDDVDCDDTNSSVGGPLPAGTACDDGDSTTSNDIIQADGCSCKGESECGETITECGVTIQTDGRKVTFLSTTETGRLILTVTTRNWSWAGRLCNDYWSSGNCNAGAAVTVPYAGTFVIHVQGGTQCSSFEVTLQDCPTGKKPNGMENNIDIYPNPSSEEVIVNFDYTDSGVLAIFNQLGQQMMRKEIREAQTSFFDVSEMDTGLYFLVFTDDQRNIYTEKLMIK